MSSQSLALFSITAAQDLPEVTNAGCCPGSKEALQLWGNIQVGVGCEHYCSMEVAAWIINYFQQKREGHFVATTSIPRIQGSEQNFAKN
jgi:hypothetical protein